MVFTSPVFLFLFLPFTLIMYFLIKKEYRNAFLFIMSSLFYYYGEQKMLWLMYFVILINYATSLFIDWVNNKKDKAEISLSKAKFINKTIIITCVLVCVGLLWYYKYWNFSITTFNRIAALIGLSYKLSLVDKIILPLGISFYTFHCLSYSLDVYMGKMRADKNLLHFATYVLMFPQLVAGPIVRYIDIKKQIENRSISAVGFGNGIRRFCFGMGKKVLIANTVAKVVDKIFALPVQNLDAATAWLGAIGYTLQIYFDFSGYSDMAIGIAAMFGFHYKENFNYPYISKSVSEFWRRWHISLSTWLRDYVYINLGGNRVAPLRYNCNILIVFLLSGLWHGANMTFVAWGLWYGLFIVLENLFLKDFMKRNYVLAHLYTLLVIVFGWVMFRANSVSIAAKYWGKMLGTSSLYAERVLDYLNNDILLALVLGIFFSIDWRTQYKNIVLRYKSHKRFACFKTLSYAAAVLILLLCITSVMSSTYNPFIYFRF